MNDSLRFRARIRINGINPYVPVSAARAARLKAGWRRPLPVLIRINGKPDAAWRINLMPVGDGSFYLYLHGDVRDASSTAVGDVVAVEVRFDDEYRGGPAGALPAWFALALDRDAGARAAWDALIPSRRKEVLRYLVRLKSDDARARNLAKVLRILAGTKERFMARTWNE